MSPISLTHLLRMTDQTGLLQHAYYSTPRRSEGYSSDDNARGLLLMARQAAVAPDDEVIRLAAIYLSSLESAQDDQGHFRNFMTYDRRWADPWPSEDCHGRCLWALAEAAGSPLPDGLRETAWQMFLAGVEHPGVARYPRSTAFGLLALERALGARGEKRLEELAQTAAERLTGWFAQAADDRWAWFEDTIVYAAARLPHALFAASGVLSRPEVLDVARRSLDFLIRETVREGCLVPVGNNGWYPRNGTKAEFDQQPIEAMAMVEAALAAHRATGDSRYTDVAVLSGRWFTGSNCLGLEVADPERGSCYDGLRPDGVNQNHGAESMLAWLISQQALAKAGLSL